MVAVESSAAKRMETLSALLSPSLLQKDFTDDRLADALRWLSDDECWEEIEQELGARLVRVHDLRRSRGRSDSTTIPVYHGA